MFYSNGAYSLFKVDTPVISGGATPPSFEDIYSYKFDGVDDFIDCGLNANLSFGNTSSDFPFTFSMWVKVDDLSTGHTLVERGDYSTTNNREQIFYIGSDGAIYNLIYSNGQSLNRRGRKTSTGIISPNTWHHIAWTYDGQGGTNASNGIKIYLDGTRVDNANNQKNSYVAMKNTNTSFKIGEFINGNMDEVAVFNSELSQSDVTSIFNNGIPNDISSLSPLSFWRMGESANWDGSNWTLTDQGSGGNNATSQNMIEASRVTDVPPNPFKSTKSILLDGIDDHVNIGTSLNFLGNKSVSMWLKFTDSGGYRVALNVGSDAYGMYSTAGKIAFYHKNTSNAYKDIVATTNTNDGQWHHYLGVNDGINLKIYIDGVLDNSNTKGSNGTLANANGRIGARWNNLNLFSGSIDEVAIFDTDQSANAFEIGGTIPTDLSSYNPLGWWRCGDGDTSPILSDNGSGGNDGTMTNFSTFSTDVPT